MPRKEERCLLAAFRKSVPAFLITIMLVVTLAVLVYPYLATSKGNGVLDNAAEELSQRLRRSRDRVYEEIRALQQEYFLGNLTEEAYRTQLQKARLEAAQLMKQQQEVQQTLIELEAAIEEEVTAASMQAPLSSKPESITK